MAFGPSPFPFAHRAFLATGLACQAISGASWAQSGPYGLSVTVQQVERVFNTQASFKLPLSACQAWLFIVDYDAATTIPGVVSSRTTRLDGARVRVERTLRETFLFFPIRMHTVLEFTEIDGKGTDFVQLEGQARSHRGSWRLEPAADGTVFRYRAVSEPDSSLPMPVIRYFLDRRLQSSFAAMADQGAQRRQLACPASIAF